MNEKRAVILVSGGLDSTTVLAMAQAQGYECYTLSFDYGQRHRAELAAAEQVTPVALKPEPKVSFNTAFVTADGPLLVTRMV